MSDVTVVAGLPDIEGESEEKLQVIVHVGHDHISLGKVGDEESSVLIENHEGDLQVSLTGDVKTVDLPVTR